MKIIMRSSMTREKSYASRGRIARLNRKSTRTCPALCLRPCGCQQYGQPVTECPLCHRLPWTRSNSPT
jgi:hypothetical protein